MCRGTSSVHLHGLAAGVAATCLAPFQLSMSVKPDWGHGCALPEAGWHAGAADGSDAAAAEAGLGLQTADTLGCMPDAAVPAVQPFKIQA